MSSFTWHLLNHFSVVIIFLLSSWLKSSIRKKKDESAESNTVSAQRRLSSTVTLDDCFAKFTQQEEVIVCSDLIKLCSMDAEVTVVSALKTFHYYTQTSFIHNIHQLDSLSVMFIMFRLMFVSC